MKKEAKNLTIDRYVKKTSSLKEPSIKNNAPLGEEVQFPTLATQIIVAISLIIGTIVTYLPSLSYPFQFDDLSNITKRFALRSDNPIERWRTNTRWIGDWLNSINYRLGKFDPFYYRATNTLIHCLTGVVLFFLALQICKKINHSFFKQHALLIASFSAGLFLLHPVQTQTISYIIQGRVEGIASLLIASIVLSFMLFRQATGIFSQLVYLGLIAALTLASCGSKEIIIVTPLLLIIVDWFFIAEQDWAVFKKGWWFYACYIPYFAYLVNHYFLTAKFATEAITLQMTLHNNSGNILTQDPTEIIKPLHFLISEFKVILHYITMFLWPAGICVEYDWKLASHFFSADVIFPGLVLLGLAGFALNSAYKRTYAYLSAPLLWFFICIAPRSTIIPSPELACDYKTYLASFGILFIIGACCSWLTIAAIRFLQSQSFWLKSSSQQLLGQALACALIFTPIAYATTQRNTIWRCPVEFWQDCTKKAPLKARPHNNLGVSLCEQGRYQEAITEYKKAISLDGLYHDPWSNIAVAYSMINDVDKAIESLKRAISIQCYYPEAYNNLGSLYLEKKDLDQAEKMLAIALKMRPYYGKAHFNNARLCELKNDLPGAWESLKKATEGDLDTPDVFFKLGQMSLQIGKYEEGIQAFNTVLKLGQKDPKIFFSLANCHYLLGNYDDASRLYKKLTSLDPNDYRYAYNHAEVHMSKKNYAEALPLYERASLLSKNNPQVLYRQSSCLAQLKRYQDAKNCLHTLLTNPLPENLKLSVRNELTRLDIEEKVTTGNNSIKLSELTNALKKKTATS